MSKTKEKPLNLSYCVFEHVLIAQDRFVDEETQPDEIVVIDVSPSRKYVKIRYISANDNCHPHWVANDLYDIIEVLTDNQSNPHLNANTPSTPPDR